VSLRTILTIALLILTTTSVVSCGTTTTAVVLRGVSALRILGGVLGSSTDRDTLCAYYTEHHDEVEAVREFAKANWQSVPEKYKPALLAINEQLNTCDAEVATVAKKTTARALLDALKRAVAFYRELKSAGVL
jgi:hypothetical protein